MPPSGSDSDSDADCLRCLRKREIVELDILITLLFEWYQAFARAYREVRMCFSLGEKTLIQWCSWCGIKYSDENMGSGTCVEGLIRFVVKM